ncbi:MAG TPA: hypothetical protein DEA47_05135 [Peptococcaceae bacterium]|nr:MAG: 3D domain protein [Clostridia bacterium 41_269]HBT20727.1 hypothetical protein [Peptococcaceae bacterium]
MFVSKESANFKLLVAALLVFCFIVVGFTVAHKNVEIEYDGKRFEVSTFAGSVKELLKQEGITLNPGDRVSPGLDKPLKDGTKVVITRGFKVDIIVDGKKFKTIKTAETKVKDILKNAGIEPGSDMIVKPKLNTLIDEETNIYVTNVVTKKVAVKETVPFKTIKKEDRLLRKGKTRVVREGAKGVKELTYRIMVANGKVIKRELLKVKVLKQPVDKIIAVGTLNTLSRGGSTYRYSKVLNMVATAYTHTGWNTATGKRPRKGTVAVDPSVIPLGTRLYIEGYGYGIAQDVGSSIKGGRIDVFFESKDAALRWGRKRVKVYILE